MSAMLIDISEDICELAAWDWMMVSSAARFPTRKRIR